MDAKEYERRLVFARQATAQAWCTTDTSNIDIDPILAEAFAKILVEHMYLPNLGCATTGELIEELKARVELGCDGLDYKTIGDTNE